MARTMLPIRDHNPSEKIPVVTFALVVTNCVIFVAMLGLEQNSRAMAEIYYRFALIPAVSDPMTFVTSQFLHGSFMHLAGNMLFLWIFGDNLEEEMGHLGFLLFYLASGVLAGLAQNLASPGSTVPMIGASGAIAGVMGGYLLLFPRARVDVLFIFFIIFRVIPIPAWIVLSAWFAIQIFSGTSTPSSVGGVAYWAHAGGFVAGLVMAIPAWTRRGAARYWRRTAGRPPHPETAYRSSIPRIPRRR